MCRKEGEMGILAQGWGGVRSHDAFKFFGIFALV